MRKRAIKQGKGGRLLHNMAEITGRTCLACRLGCRSPVGSAQHRPRREQRPAPGRSPPGCRPPRHAPQAGLQPHLVAESLCALTKNREASIVLASLFLAGAEGLGLRSAPVSSRQSATGARSPLGTRFWSGCGEAHQRAGEGQCCPVLPDKSRNSGADLVL